MEKISKINVASVYISLHSNESVKQCFFCAFNGAFSAVSTKCTLLIVTAHQSAQQILKLHKLICKCTFLKFPSINLWHVFYENPKIFACGAASTVFHNFLLM